MPTPNGPLRLFQPGDADELLTGWHLHVARRREIHEQAARRAQAAHFVVGSMAAVLAALAGSSMVSSWNSAASSGLVALGGGTGAVAAMLAGFQTFLDPGGRAERHRQAASAYKGHLREFERVAERRSKASTCGPLSNEDLCTWLGAMKDTLQVVDDKAPVVPRGLAKSVEGRAVLPARTARELTGGGSPGPDPRKGLRARLRRTMAWLRRSDG